MLMDETIQRLNAGNGRISNEWHVVFVWGRDRGSLAAIEQAERVSAARFGRDSGGNRIEMIQLFFGQLGSARAIRFGPALTSRNLARVFCKLP
jgi:hypothetical protein